MKKKKTFRKSIRISGKSESKTFATKGASDEWYHKMRDKKPLIESGVALPLQTGVLVKDFALGPFMENRRANYPESTWMPDEQRLRDHILPAIGDMQISNVDSTHVRALLVSIVNKKQLSTKTRDRIRALVSALYNEAINSEPPLAKNNPTFGLSFKGGRRVGSPDPSYLHTTEECVAYLSAAESLGHLHLGIAVLGLYAGLRKQEMIALEWGHVDPRTQTIQVCRKYMQASGQIVRGTKKGDAAKRFVPMNDELMDYLSQIRGASKHSDDDDHVLANKDGSHLKPRQVYDLHMETCDKAKVSCTVHGLRHTFGREFASRSQNIHALKDILGHSNLLVTQMYSELGKERLKSFREVVSFKNLTRQVTTKNDNE